MRRCRRLPSAALALAVLMLVSVAAPASGVEVWIDHPTPDEFVYGLVDVVVTLTGEEPVAAVEFIVDGETAGVLQRPPYRLTVDVGSDNVAHEFKVVVRTVSGLSASSVVETAPLTIDESLELSLQQLYVTVTRGDARVLDLRPDDFRVTEEGRRQKIVTFERGDVPLTAVLLLDASLSMHGERIRAALEGASLFLEGMASLDEAMVMLFSDRLLRMTEFSGEAARLAQALSDVEAQGGTAINDHLFLALSRLDERQGRRVVVLLSDGADVHSIVSMREVLEKIRLSQALVYWIYLRQDPDEDEVPAYTSAWRDVEGNQEEFQLLRRAVADSGGRVELVDHLEELRGAFVEILRELREQYVLGYYPEEAGAKPGWREVKVRVDRPGLKVRARDGYVAF